MRTVTVPEEKRPMISDTGRDRRRSNEGDSNGLPKDAQGAIARWNELKHGMCIKAIDLCKTSSPVFQELLGRWFSSLQPRDDVEEFMSKMLFHELLGLERVDRALIASRIMHVHEEARRQEQEVLTLGSRLFFDPRGPAGIFGEPRFSREEERDSQRTGADPSHDPAWLVERLESTAAGCRWLLEQWAELGGMLEKGERWQESELFQAVRLMGRQLIDVLDLPELAEILLASHAINRRSRNAFTDLRSELRVDEIKARLIRMRRRSGTTLDPRDAAQGREHLSAIVARATSRLEAKAAEHRKRACADESAGAAEPAFDRTPAGEALNRDKREYARAVSRTLTALRRHRLDVERRTRGGGAAGGERRKTERRETGADHAPKGRQ